MRGKRENTESVRQQGINLLNKMFLQGKGTSKHKDKLTGKTADKIYSDVTLQTYKQAWNDYCDSLKANNFKVNGHTPRTLEEASEFVNQYLEELCNRPGKTEGSSLSAWSVRTKFAGVGKVLKLSAKDYQLPSRKTDSITRSRTDTKSDKHFSEKNNSELTNFCRCTGLRNKKELQQIKNDCLVVNADGSFSVRVKGKGGKLREAPIIGSESQVKAVVNRIKSTADGVPIWQHVHSHADIHGYRREYANSLYNSIARNTASLSRKEKYICRGNSYKEFDRAAMQTVSFALGHSRLNVVAEHYLNRE